MSRVTGRVCGIDNCRSRRFHVGPDGHTYCSNGHQAEDQLTQIDEDAYAGRGGARRTRIRTDEIIETTGAYKGVKATELGLQCFQLVLRRQLYWLINTLGYPKQLETIVRDLWCLRAQMLRDIMNSASQDDSSQQLFSTQSHTEDSDATNPETSLKTAFLERKFPKLLESLSLLYLGLIMMKIPISTGDVNEWLSDERFIYLQASSIIPRSMKQKLASHWQKVFMPQDDINYHQYSGFHATTMNLVAAFQRKVGITMPVINSDLLLSRFIIGLSLPVELVRLVNRLAQLVEVTFKFPLSKPRYRKVSSFPEVRLLSLLLIAAKLTYPFDGIPRNPLSASEPAVLSLNWDQWQKIRDDKKEFIERQHKVGNKELFGTTEDKVFKMTDSQIDKYLDWFGRTWINDDESRQEIDTDFQRAMKRMFPLDIDDRQNGGRDAIETGACSNVEDIDENILLKLIQTAMKSNKIVSESSAQALDTQVVRPGERYLDYRVVNDLPMSARPLFEAAAKMVGLSLSSMIIAVNQMEIKLKTWQKGLQIDLQD